MPRKKNKEEKDTKLSYKELIDLQTKGLLTSAQQKRLQELERARSKNAAALAARTPAKHLNKEDLETIKKLRALNPAEEAQLKYLEGLERTRKNLKERQKGVLHLRLKDLDEMIARGEVLTDAQNLRWKILRRNNERRINPKFKKKIIPEVRDAKKLTAAQLIKKREEEGRLNKYEENRLFRLQQKQKYTQSRRNKEKPIGPLSEEATAAQRLSTRDLDEIEKTRPLNSFEKDRRKHLESTIKTKEQRAAKELNAAELIKMKEEQKGYLDSEQERRLNNLLKHQISARKRRALQKEKNIVKETSRLKDIKRKLLLKIPLTWNEERHWNKHNKKLEGKNKAKKIASPPKSTKNKKLVLMKNNVRENYKKFKRLASERNPHHCAVCNVETKHFLELAHIVPFYERQYTTDPDNCLFLCPMHHRCFDNFYFIIKKNGTVIINSYIIDFDSESNAILNIRKKIKLTKKQADFFQLKNELRNNNRQKIIAEIKAKINSSNNANETMTSEQIKNQKYRIKFLKQRLELFEKITTTNKTNNKNVLKLKKILKNLNLENLKLLNSNSEFQQIITETLNGMTEKEYLSHIKFLRNLGISFSRTQLWIEKYLFTLRKELSLNSLEMTAESNSESDWEDEELEEDKLPSWQIRGSFTHEQIEVRNLIIKQQKSCCTFCGFDASDLLEAAHIIPFKNARSKSMKIANFLPLCMNHHRCFDRNYLLLREDGLGNWIISINFYEANGIFDQLFFKIKLTPKQDILLRKRKILQELDALEYQIKVLKSKKLTKQQRQDLGKMFLEEKASSSLNISNLNDIWQLSYNQLKENNEFQSFFKNINKWIINKNFFLRKMKIKRAIGRQLSREEMLLEFYLTKELEEKNRTFNPEQRDSISKRDLVNRVSINQNQYSEQVGDCFYQAILAHNNIPQLRNLTVYQLRQICVDYFNDNLTNPIFREKIAVLLRNILRERQYAQENNLEVSPQHQDFLSWIESDLTIETLTEQKLAELTNTYINYYQSYSMEYHIWGGELEGRILLEHFRSNFQLPPEFNIYLLERQSFDAPNEDTVYSISTIDGTPVTENVNLNSGSIFIINSGNNHFERFNPELHNVTSVYTFDGNVVTLESGVSNERALESSPEQLGYEFPYNYNLLVEPHSSDEEGELIGDSFYQVLLENEQLKDFTVSQLRQICIDYFQDNINNAHFRTNIANMLIAKEGMEESKYVNEFLNSLPSEWNFDSLERLTEKYIEWYILCSHRRRIPGNTNIEGTILLNHFRDKLGLGENLRRIYVLRQIPFSSDETNEVENVHFISLLGQNTVISEQFIDSDETMIIIETEDGFERFNSSNPEHPREVFNLNDEPVIIHSQRLRERMIHSPQVRETNSDLDPINPIMGSTLYPFSYNEQPQVVNNEDWAYHNPDTSPFSNSIDDDIYTSEEESGDEEDEEQLTLDEEAFKEIRDNRDNDPDDNTGNNIRPTSNSESNTNSYSTITPNNNSHNSNQTNSANTKEKTIGYYLFSFRNGKLRFEYICDHPKKEAFILKLSKKKEKQKKWEIFRYFPTKEETGEYLNEWVKKEYPESWVLKTVNKVFGFTSKILDSSTMGSGSNTTSNNNSSGNEGKLSAFLAGIAANNYLYNESTMEQKRQLHYQEEEWIKEARRIENNQSSYWDRRAEQTAEQCENIAHAMETETGLLRHQMTNPENWEPSGRSYQSETNNNFKTNLEDSNVNQPQVSNEPLLVETTSTPIPEQVQCVSSSSSNRVPVAEVRIKDNDQKASNSKSKDKKSNVPGNSIPSTASVPVGSNIHTLPILTNENVNTNHVVVDSYGGGFTYTGGSSNNGQGNSRNNARNNNSYPQPTVRLILRTEEYWKNQRELLKQQQKLSQEQSSSNTVIPQSQTSGRGNNEIKRIREKQVAAQRRETLVPPPEYNPNQSSGPSGTGTFQTQATRQWEFSTNKRRQEQISKSFNTRAKTPAVPSSIENNLSYSPRPSNRPLSLIAAALRAKQQAKKQAKSTQPKLEEHSHSM